MATDQTGFELLEVVANIILNSSHPKGRRVERLNMADVRKFVTINNVEMTFNATNGYDSGYGKKYYFNVIIPADVAEHFTAEGLKVWTDKAGNTCATIKAGKKLLENKPNITKLMKGAKINIDCYIDEFRGYKFIKAYDVDVIEGKFYEAKETEAWGEELPF